MSREEMFAVGIMGQDDSFVINWVEVCLFVVPVVMLRGLNIDFLLLVISIYHGLHVSRILHKRHCNLLILIIN